MAISDRPSERTQRVAAMLAATLALPERERCTFLDGACPDAETRREIDALVASLATSARKAPARWRRASAVFAVAADLSRASRRFVVLARLPAFSLTEGTSLEAVRLAMSARDRQAEGGP